MAKVLKNLRAVREGRLLTQHQLAEKAKLTAKCISDAERGKGVALSTVKKLSIALGVEPGALLGE